MPLHLAFKQHDRYVCFSNEGSKFFPLYRDTDHVSTAGAVRAAEFVMPYLAQAK